MTGRLLAALAAGSLLLAGCGVDVRDEIRGTVEDITVDANGRDVAAVRAGVEELLQQLDRAVREGQMTAEEATALAALATRIRDSAQLLEAPTPTPTPSATSASPSPSATPSEEPEDTPTPEPTQEEPTPEPPESQEPAPEPTGVLPEPSLSPAALERPATPVVTTAP